MLVSYSGTGENVMRFWVIIAASLLASGCSGGNGASGVPPTSQQAATAKHAGKSTRVEAHVALTTTMPFSQRAAHQHKLQPNETPIAEEALQVGHAYPHRESWGYSDIDPSCGSLTWTYDNKIPGVTVTMNPTETGLDGRSEVSFSTIPVGTPTGVYHETVTGTCTGTDPTGNLPVPTEYTIAVVTMDVGLIPQIPAAPTIESDMTFKPVVGQFIELKAVADPDVTLRKSVWKPIPGNIIGSYTETTAMASPKPFDADDLKKQTIDFYWIQDTKGSPVDIRVDAVFPVKAIHCGSTCTGAEDEWGATDAESKADIVAPTGVTLSSQTGKVLVGLDPSVGCIPALHFGFYGTDTCPGKPTGPNGIRWTFRATAPKGGAGDLDATQLIERTDSRTALPGPGEIRRRRSERTANHCLINACATATITICTSRSPRMPRRRTRAPTRRICRFPDGKRSRTPIRSRSTSSTNRRMKADSPRRHPDKTFGYRSVCSTGTGKAPRRIRAPVRTPTGNSTSSSYSHGPSGVAGYTPLPTWTGLFDAVKTICPSGG